ncbi:MAG: hypothetical protein JO316_21165 [Abitibacteriaceae bacterium]|nr:hypothetical protein [Abditibacteriaceae bacterium]MBV9867872.1 hypothetical protein [Abditibacteriaceae bacterium]
MSDEIHEDKEVEAEDAPPEDEELETALADALGEDSRAAELRQMQAALQHRRELILREIDTVDEAERRKLNGVLDSLDEQIAILAEEAEITKFIEDSVRVGLEMRRLSSG